MCHTLIHNNESVVLIKFEVVKITLLIRFDSLHNNHETFVYKFHYIYIYHRHPYPEVLGVLGGRGVVLKKKNRLTSAISNACYYIFVYYPAVTYLLLICNVNYY